MPDKTSGTQIIQGQFLELASSLHKAISSISEFDDPGKSKVLQDLRSVADSLGGLQSGVTDRLQTRKQKQRPLKLTPTSKSERNWSKH